MAREEETRLVYSTGDPVPAERGRAGGRDKGSRAPSGAPASGGSGIKLRLDRRASSRLVTVLTGLPGSAAEITRFARELRAACGAGGAVKDGAVELQGDHREAVEAALTARGLKWKRTGG